MTTVRAISSLLIVMVLVPAAWAADLPPTKECKDGRSTNQNGSHKALYGDDFITKPFWNLKNAHRLTFPTKKIVAAEPGVVCPPKGKETYSAGEGSIFVEHARTEDGNNTTLVGEFTFVNECGIPADAKKPELNKPYLVCLSSAEEPADERIPSWNVRRAGGVDTGVLVIPFKVRQGDLFSDSTIGPYFAFSGATFTVLTTFGLSQVSVSADTDVGVKTETGLTFALGAIWRLKKDWNIGLVAGVDHLSGDAGANFQFQDKLWWSFAIGYQFAQ